MSDKSRSIVGFIVKTSKPYAVFDHGIRLFYWFDWYDPDKNRKGNNIRNRAWILGLFMFDTDRIR